MLVKHVCESRHVPFWKYRILPCNDLLFLELIVIILNPTTTYPVSMYRRCTCCVHCLFQNTQGFVCYEVEVHSLYMPMILIIKMYLWKISYHFLSTPWAPLSLKNNSSFCGSFSEELKLYKRHGRMYCCDGSSPPISEFSKEAKRMSLYFEVYLSNIVDLR